MAHYSIVHYTVDQVFFRAGARGSLSPVNHKKIDVQSEHMVQL